MTLCNVFFCGGGKKKLDDGDKIRETKSAKNEILRKANLSLKKTKNWTDEQTDRQQI